MYRIGEIKKLLRSHSYAPIVRSAGDGVLITVPTQPVEAYNIRRGVECGVFFSSATSAEKFISIPEHAIRLFIMSDISACCGRVPMSDELIYYIDEEGNERDTLEQIIQSPSNEEERRKEGFLTTLFIEARADGFPPAFEDVAREHGVHDGYRLIKAFFPRTQGLNL